MATIVRLIKDLARYERASDQVEVDNHDLHDALFGASPHVYCHLVEDDGRVIAMAVWYLNFSTWLGTSGIYLEDLYVSDDARGRGAGTALMKELARVCAQKGYRRFEWSVLDWNTPSIRFYKSIGALAMDEWTTYRLSDGALERFALGD